MTFTVKFAGAISGLALLVSATAAQAEVLFWSTQAKPVEEAQELFGVVSSEISTSQKKFVEENLSLAGKKIDLQPG